MQKLTPSASPNRNLGRLTAKAMVKYLVKSTLLLVLALLLMVPSVALAAEPEPTSVSLTDIEIFDGLLLTADSLAVVTYNVAYSSNPSYDISDTYIFRLLSPDGSTEIGTTTADPTYNDGYGLGAISFYVATGLTDNAAYIFRVQQNPVHYPSPNYWDFVIGAVNYNGESDQANALRSDIILRSIGLSIAFDTALTTRSEAGDLVLSDAGEIYYLSAIPGLQAMAPDLFDVEIENPSYAARSWPTTTADALLTKYNGTIFGESMTGFAGLFSLERNTAANAVSVFVFILVVMISVWKFRASMLSALLDGYVALLLLVLLGTFGMLWAGFMAFVSAVAGGAVVFFKRA